MPRSDATAESWKGSLHLVQEIGKWEGGEHLSQGKNIGCLFGEVLCGPCSGTELLPWLRRQVKNPENSTQNKGNSIGNCQRVHQNRGQSTCTRNPQWVGCGTAAWHSKAQEKGAAEFLTVRQVKVSKGSEQELDMILLLRCFSKDTKQCKNKT